MERRYKILVFRGGGQSMIAPNSPMDKNQGEKKRRSSGLAIGVVAETVVIVGSVEEAAIALVVVAEHAQEVERPESPFTSPPRRL